MVKNIKTYLNNIADFIFPAMVIAIIGSLIIKVIFALHLTMLLQKGNILSNILEFIITPFGLLSGINPLIEGFLSGLIITLIIWQASNKKILNEAIILGILSINFQLGIIFAIIAGYSMYLVLDFTYKKLDQKHDILKSFTAMLFATFTLYVIYRLSNAIFSHIMLPIIGRLFQPTYNSEGNIGALINSIGSFAQTIDYGGITKAYIEKIMSSIQNSNPSAFLNYGANYIMLSLASLLTLIANKNLLNLSNKKIMYTVLSIGTLIASPIAHLVLLIRYPLTFGISGLVGIFANTALFTLFISKVKPIQDVNLISLVVQHGDIAKGLMSLVFVIISSIVTAGLFTILLKIKKN